MEPTPEEIMKAIQRVRDARFVMTVHPIDDGYLAVAQNESEMFGGGIRQTRWSAVHSCRERVVAAYGPDVSILDFDKEPEEER
jgi:hypothetical protein